MAGKHGLQKLGGGIGPSKQEMMSTETEGEKLDNREEWKGFGMVIMESKSELTTNCNNMAEHMEELLRLVTKNV